MEKVTQTPSQKQADTILSAAIMHAIEMESNFKLYTYRIISQDQYITRTKELIQFFDQTLKIK